MRPLSRELSESRQNSSFDRAADPSWMIALAGVSSTPGRALRRCVVMSSSSSEGNQMQAWMLDAQDG